MGLYRSKPYTVEAWRYDSDGAGLDIMVACPDAVTQRCDDPPGATFLIVHDIRADKGDWIVRDARGNIFPLDPTTFAAKFEPADAATAIAHNQIITPAQLPGGDEHTLERLDDAEARDYAGPPVLIAPYKRPADKRVKGLLDDAARNRAAEGERAAPRALFSDPRLAPNYKPPKKPPQH
jgi:hypothetical protein